MKILKGPVGLILLLIVWLGTTFLLDWAFGG